jgi:hypothetical protein
MRLSATLITFLSASVHGAADIPTAYQDVAVTNGIPPAVFYAIALTESGRKVPTLNAVRPWPWSANFGGRGRFFNSRREAWRAIQDYIGKGHRSVDVGLMQVNWRYHHLQLRSVWRALDPHVNLMIAADILTACYLRLGDWWKSVGCYHAPTNAKHASAYRDRVRGHWRELVL